MLALQPRTRKELADGLRRRGISDDIADAVLDRFGDVGLVEAESVVVAGHMRISR